MFELTSIHKYITIVTFYLSYIDELDIVKCLSVVNVETQRSIDKIFQGVWFHNNIAIL